MYILGVGLMKVLLNERELTLSFGADASLGEVLADVQDNDIMDNQVLAGIWIDGEELTSESLSVLGGRCVREFGEARIEAPTREEMALHGICTLIDSLNASIGLGTNWLMIFVRGERGGRSGGCRIICRCGLVCSRLWAEWLGFWKWSWVSWRLWGRGWIVAGGAGGESW